MKTLYLEPEIELLQMQEGDIFTESNEGERVGF